jgi:hypothetical protein
MLIRNGILPRQDRGSRTDRRQREELHSRPDAVFVGDLTMRRFWFP